MRRFLTISALVVLVALVPAFAQRGGVRGYSGGHGVVSGHPSGGHVYGGVHIAPGFGTSFRGSGFRGEHFREGGFRHHCYGCGRYGYPFYFGYGYGGYYDPFWWSDSSSSYNYDEDNSRELVLASQMNALNVEEQNLRQREEWDRESREREERDEDAYARRSPSRDEGHVAPAPATVLVFRDQHRQEVSNYAIAGGTLWVLNEQAAKKIPLSELDLAATAKANDERGVEFQVPK
jgi:hypothetical protein